MPTTTNTAEPRPQAGPAQPAPRPRKMARAAVGAVAVVTCGLLGGGVAYASNEETAPDERRTPRATTAPTARAAPSRPSTAAASSSPRVTARRSR
jgi:hypothetical protein